MKDNGIRKDLKMKIILNNTPEEFDQEIITVDELLKLKKFTFKMLVIRINGNLVKKDEYNTALVRDKDDVMVLHLVSGG
jgi:sulfur carrier protein